MYLTWEKSVDSLRSVTATPKAAPISSGLVPASGNGIAPVPAPALQDSPATLVINFATPEDALKAQLLFDGFNQRLAHVEFEQNRFTNALLAAGEMLFSNPSFKMITMAMPKEIKEKLQKFFGKSCNTVTPKT